MRFLADESCDARVVEALRQAGHDVVAVAETAPGARDSEVLSWAHRERRVLIAEDRDFGRLVFASGLPAEGGILFVRCPEAARPRLPESIVRVVERGGAHLQGAFSVWSPHRFRIRRVISG